MTTAKSYDELKKENKTLSEAVVSLSTQIAELKASSVKDLLDERERELFQGTPDNTLQEIFEPRYSQEDSDLDIDLDKRDPDTGWSLRQILYGVARDDTLPDPPSQRRRSGIDVQLREKKKKGEIDIDRQTECGSIRDLFE